MFNMREHCISYNDNVQEQTKDTTFEKLSEQVVQIQKSAVRCAKVTVSTKQM